MSITTTTQDAITRNGALGGTPFRLGYDATQPKLKRKAPVISTKTEDRELQQAGRQQVSSATRDLQRNFSIAAWAVRKHLDYVSTFSFQARTGIPELDDQIESLMSWWSRPTNCDAAGRHSLPRLVRLFEERRTIDGDVLVNMLADGRIQGIEGDRIFDGSGTPLPAEGVLSEEIVNGVWVNVNGRANAYAIHRRHINGTSFEQWLPATFTYLHGCYQRFDQVRGVSPLVAAINTLRDVYEGFDYALAKAKVQQLFALAFYRERGEDALGGVEEITASGTAEGESAATPDEPRYKLDFGNGAAVVDLDDGDRMEAIESKSPSSEFQAYTQMMIGVALKALDIPYSFYDESHTNYAGARQALLQYEQSADIKRGEVKQMLDRITGWRLAKFVRDGDLDLPAGVTLGSLSWEWIARGIPWIDPLKEVTGNVTAVGALLQSPQEIAKARGRDAFDIIDEIAEWQQYAQQKGLTVNTGSVTVGVNANDNQADSSSGNAPARR